MSKDTVPLSLELLRELQHILDKAKNPGAAPYVAGLANGIITSIIGNAEKATNNNQQKG